MTTHDEQNEKIIILPDATDRTSASVGYMNAAGELVWVGVPFGEIPEPPDWAVDPREFGADRLLASFNSSVNSARFGGWLRRCVFCGRGRRRCECVG